MKRKGEISWATAVVYGSGDIASNLVWTTVGSFLTLYYTDIALISAGFIGTMMLVARILDGVSDVIMGTIIDRTKTRWGKARPWVVISAPFLCIGFICLFNVPGSFSETGKELYAVITYIFVCVFAFTAESLAYVVLCNMMSSDTNVRNWLNSVRFFESFIAALVLNSFTAKWAEGLGGGQAGWTKLTAVFGILSLCMFLAIGAVCKEDKSMQEDIIDDSQQVGFLEGVKAVFATSRYGILMVLMYIMFYIALVGSNGAAIYFARDVMGDAGYMLQLTVFSMVPGMIIMLFIPKITEITGVWKGMMMGGAIFAAGFLITMLAPNHAMIYAGCIVRGTGQAIFSPLMITVVAQLADFNCLKNDNKPLIGITNCVVSVGNKVGTGLAGAIIGWGLAYAGYDGSAAVQAAHTVSFEKMLYCLIPLIAAVLLLVFTSGLNVEKALNELKEKKNAASA